MSTVNETQLVSDVRQLKQKSAADDKRMKHLERQLEVLQISTKEDLRLRIKEAEEFRNLLQRLESKVALHFLSLEKSCECFHHSAEKKVVGMNGKLVDVIQMAQETEDTLTQEIPVLRSLEALAIKTQDQLQSTQRQLTKVERQVHEIASFTGESHGVSNIATRNLQTVPVGRRESNMWTFQSRTNFEVKKAMGSWFAVETIKQNSPVTVNLQLLKYTFTQTSHLIKERQSFIIAGSVAKTIQHFDVKEVPQNPHVWKDNGHQLFTIWIKTDYESCAIIGRSDDVSIASIDQLFIHSRKQTLTPKSLEMLRDVVIKLGFSKSNGVNKCGDLFELKIPLVAQTKGIFLKE